MCQEYNRDRQNQQVVGLHFLKIPALDFLHAGGEIRAAGAEFLSLGDEIEPHLVLGAEGFDFGGGAGVHGEDGDEAGDAQGSRANAVEHPAFNAPAGDDLQARRCRRLYARNSLPASRKVGPCGEVAEMCASRSLSGV